MKTKKKSKLVEALVPHPTERPTPELAARGVVELVTTTVDGVEAQARRLTCVSALSRLERQGRLDPKQLKAAVRFFADWHRSRMEPMAQSKLVERVQGGQGGAATAEARLNAAGSYAAACRLLRQLHPGCLTVVESLVIHGETTEGAGRAVAAGYRDARLVGARAQALLEVGLWQLAVHYGYA